MGSRSATSSITALRASSCWTINRSPTWAPKTETSSGFSRRLPRAREPMTDVLRIAPESLAEPAENRFERFKLIGWWDQSRLSRARVVVVGAGALGNEIVKNLALLGVGNLFIADMDRIENSNLSRSVLYREADSGAAKADTAAKAARSIYPEIHAHAFHGNVVYDLGLGV